MQFALEVRTKMRGKGHRILSPHRILWKSEDKIDFVGDLYCVFMLPLFNSKQATIRCWPAGVR
jgi:hypothetical protein